MEGRVTYFHEEQSFRKWWLWVPLAIAALPVAVVLARGGPALEVIVVPVVVLAIGALFAFARLVVDVDGDAITIAFHLSGRSGGSRSRACVALRRRSTARSSTTEATA